MMKGFKIIYTIMNHLINDLLEDNGIGADATIVVITGPGGVSDISYGEVFTIFKCYNVTRPSYSLC